MEGMRGSSYTLCETFCILEFSRKLAVKSAYPRVLSAKNLTGGKLRPDRHAVDPYAPLPLPLFPFSSAFHFRSRNPRVLILTAHLLRCLGYPATRFALFFPLLTFFGFRLVFLSIAGGKFIVDLNRALPSPLQQLRIVERAACYFHFVDDKTTPSSVFISLFSPCLPLSSIRSS